MAQILQYAEFSRVGPAAAPAVAEQAQTDGEPLLPDRSAAALPDASLRERVLAAVMREMGADAPPEGSKSREELADRLFHAVSAHSLSRPALMSDGLRRALQDAYFSSENDSGAYGQSWRREITIYGKRGLVDETDGALLERVLIHVDHDYLVRLDGSWLGDHEQEFLALMAQDEQVEMVRAAIAEQMHCYPLETAQALSKNYQALGLSDPYDALLQEIDRAPASAPSF